MYSLHTHPIYDLGATMRQTLDRVIAEKDDAMTRRCEVTPAAPDDDDTFDIYAYACAVLER